MIEGLLKDHLELLVGDSAPESRAVVARHLTREFARHDQGPAQRTLAIDAFRLLIQDGDPTVRRALSEGLRDNPLVPHDVVSLLANDVPDVALPVLNHSIVLADDDLIEIIRTRTQAHRLAIARRDQISPLVAQALCEVRNEAVAMTLVRNPGADVDESAFARLLADYPLTSPVVVAATDHQFLTLLHGLATRSMPPALAERLVHRIAEKLKIRIEAHPHLRAAAAKLVVAARERATLALVAESTDDGARRGFVNHLVANRRLTASLIVRCMVDGEFDLAAIAIAAVSGFDAAHVRSVLDLGQTGGLAVVLRATRMQDEAAAAIETCLAAAAGFRGGRQEFDAYQAELLGAFGANDADRGALLRRLAIAPIPLTPGANP